MALSRNDGRGNFTDIGVLPTDNDNTDALALADMDNDGDLDIVFCNSWNQSKLYLNLIRQVDAPSLAAPGRDYQLDFYSLACYPRQLTVVFPFVSANETPLLMPPFGKWWLDTHRMVPLSIKLISAPECKATLTLTVPNNSILLGTGVLSQATLLSWPEEVSFTNANLDPILRI